MQQSGPVVSRHGLDIHGIGDVACAYWNYATPALYEEALRRGEGRLARGGALVVAGGVAANRALRTRLGDVAADAGIDLAVPPPELCTDNGAMIAWAGIERLRLGLTDGLDASPRARWPLDPDAPPVAGRRLKTGKNLRKGRKR